MDKENTKLIVKEPKEIDKSYLAGLVDGEGSFFIDSKSNAWNFSIGMSDKAPIEKFQKAFGLNNVVISLKQDKRKNNKPIYCLKLRRQQTQEIAKYLYPYLLAKQYVALKAVLNVVN